MTTRSPTAKEQSLTDGQISSMIPETSKPVIHRQNQHMTSYHSVQTMQHLYYCIMGFTLPCFPPSLLLSLLMLFDSPSAGNGYWWWLQ